MRGPDSKQKGQEAAQKLLDHYEELTYAAGFSEHYLDIDRIKSMAENGEYEQLIEEAKRENID